MRPRSPLCLSAALATCLLLPAAAQAGVIPFSGNFGPGLSPSNNQMVFESVARLRLNAAEPSKLGQSNTWSNPSRLPAHPVPHSGRRVEDQGLIRGVERSSGRPTASTFYMPLLPLSPAD